MCDNFLAFLIVLDKPTCFYGIIDTKGLSSIVYIQQLREKITICVVFIFALGTVRKAQLTYTVYIRGYACVFLSIYSLLLENGIKITTRPSRLLVQQILENFHKIPNVCSGRLKDQEQAQKLVRALYWTKWWTKLNFIFEMGAWSMAEYRHSPSQCNLFMLQYYYFNVMFVYLQA
jgi:hypothetical protein